MSMPALAGMNDAGSNWMKVNVADYANLSLLVLPDALKRKLEAAVLVTSDEVPPDIVTIQSQVVLAEEATGRRRVVTIVYPAEADAAAGRVSILDALSIELFGASPGDTIDWDSPEGRIRLRIEEIVYQPEHSLRRHMVVRD
jgi:regulator of nucleoside diphosphate kinase